MQLNSQVLAWIVAAVAAQGLAAQKPVIDPGDPGVSMVVTTTGGAYGFECEPFAAAPHLVNVSPGEGVIIDLYALAEFPYVIAAGMPAAQGYDLPCCQAQLVMDAPILVFELGVVAPSGMPGPCGMDRVYTKLQIPDGAPIGAQLAMQGLAFRLADDRPAFTRPVLLNVF